MSRLADLLQELCPNGVEYKKIKEVYRRIKGTPITAGKMKEIENPDGNIRVFAGGRTVINAFEKDIPNANITRVPAVLVQSRGVIDVVYYDKPFTFKHEMWAYTAENQIAVKFLYYVLKNSVQHFREAASGMGSLPQISLSVTEDFSIPVPPLPVQREIVRILDNFTELTAELTARKKQYAYYRDQLLTFGDANVPLRELRSVVKKSCSGSTPTKGNPDYYINGTIPWLRTQDVRFNEITQVDSYITEKAVAETAVKWIPENCVIVAISGATAGRCAINKIKITTNQHCLNLEIDEEEALYKYIYYCVSSRYDELISKKQGARGDLNSSLVLSLKLPVPPLEVQARIVSILDRFEALCSDLSAGLPAEIEARRRQYAYYRDQLLTFRRASV
ncbi:MAG: restriction endonuclease subunit S [Lentisphaeraceae bacterium]|nr:restriction endonuclease subunit S [Lentisphaeraceae bacterium]